VVAAAASRGCGAGGLFPSDRAADIESGAQLGASAAGPQAAVRRTIPAGGRVIPAVHQVLATLGYGDAIGHEVLGIQRVLRSAGYESDIFVENSAHQLESLTRDYRELVDASRADNLLIHHFSIGSKASRTAYALPDRMALVYHNITPPEYFVGVHRLLARQCFRGRRELRAYVDRCDLAMGDSEFNRQDLEALGFPRTAVLPVVPDFSHLDVEPNRSVADQFADDWTNVLFVGRVIANKKIEDLIRFFYAYHTRFNPRSRLIIVGMFNLFERYLAGLTHMAAELGLSHVHFTGHISNEELAAYYDVADLFLCASEHEGFCVPLVEAFYKQVPVLAYAATAVPGTMDGAGVLFRDKNPMHVAGLMDAILSNAALQDAIVDGQRAAVRRLQSQDFAGTLLGFIDRILDAPRAPAPKVTPDFWRQFDAAEALENIRKDRPSAFRALPMEAAHR
jgi:glycosyltransferase involved in cell wall biosynthesis